MAREVRRIVMSDQSLFRRDAPEQRREDLLEERRPLLDQLEEFLAVVREDSHNCFFG